MSWPLLRARLHFARTSILRVATWVLAGVWLSTLTGRSAELSIEFGRNLPGAVPAGFRSALTGGGPPPEWRVESVQTRSTLPSLTEGGIETANENVVVERSRDPTDERFPLLIYEPEIFADFTATLRFRTVGGRVEQMAGLAFRLQNETNYYVVRASSLGNSFRFYKFVDGVRSEPIGPEMRIPLGEWHHIEVQCKGNTIQCRLDGKDAIPTLTDSSFGRGRLALWTKSDSLSHFASLRVIYDVVTTLPQRLVERAVDRYPRLLAVTIVGQQEGRVVVLASSDPTQVGNEATSEERQALKSGQAFSGSARDHSAGVFPLRDRNGDPLFALRLRLRTFAGQTDANVAARGRSIADFLENLVRAADTRSE